MNPQLLLLVSAVTKDWYAKTEPSTTTPLPSIERKQTNHEITHTRWKPADASQDVFWMDNAYLSKRTRDCEAALFSARESTESAKAAWSYFYLSLPPVCWRFIDVCDVLRYYEVAFSPSHRNFAYAYKDMLSRMLKGCGNIVQVTRPPAVRKCRKKNTQVVQNLAFSWREQAELTQLFSYNKSQLEHEISLMEISRRRNWSILPEMLEPRDQAAPMYYSLRDKVPEKEWTEAIPLWHFDRERPLYAGWLGAPEKEALEMFGMKSTEDFYTVDAHHFHNLSPYELWGVSNVSRIIELADIAYNNLLPRTGNSSAERNFNRMTNFLNWYRQEYPVVIDELPSFNLVLKHIETMLEFHARDHLVRPIMAETMTEYGENLMKQLHGCWYEGGVEAAYEYNKMEHILPTTTRLLKSALDIYLKRMELGTPLKWIHFAPIFQPSRTEMMRARRGMDP